MDKDKKVVEGGLSLLAWVAVGFFGMWIFWIFTGGPARYEREHPGIFIKAPAPLDSGTTYGAPDSKKVQDSIYDKLGL
jgi:hypothetical protein